MGEVYKGIHEKIALGMRDYLGAKLLIETGTYRGDTALWARDKFDKVVTIEISPTLMHTAERRLYPDSKNVLFILGDSRQWLEPICKGHHNMPALFWLDAHWTGEMELPDPRGCPLIDEINIINQSFFAPHVIMVDDYATLKRLQWAKEEDIIMALEDKKWQDRQVKVIDDIYVACRKLPEELETWKK